MENAGSGDQRRFNPFTEPTLQSTSLTVATHFKEKGLRKYVVRPDCCQRIVCSKQTMEMTTLCWQFGCG